MALQGQDGGRCREILETLQAWSRSIPDLTTPDDAERQAPAEAHAGSLIEMLHLSQRTYLLLKRNRIHTLGDIDRERDKIPAFRNVGPKIWGAIQEAVDLTGLHPTGLCSTGLCPQEMRSDADAERVGCESHLTPGGYGL